MTTKERATQIVQLLIDQHPKIARQLYNYAPFNIASALDGTSIGHVEIGPNIWFILLSNNEWTIFKTTTKSTLLLKGKEGK